jgi:hypothetical protein
VPLRFSNSALQVIIIAFIESVSVTPNVDAVNYILLSNSWQGLKVNGRFKPLPKDVALKGASGGINAIAICPEVIVPIGELFQVRKLLEYPYHCSTFYCSHELGYGNLGRDFNQLMDMIR